MSAPDADSGGGSDPRFVERAAARMLDASVLERIAIAAGAVASALLIGLIVVGLAGYDPFGFAGDLLIGAFGSVGALARTLRFATLFILTGVAVAIAFRAGVFNIGVQGQFIVGGITGVMSIIWAAPYLPTGPLGGFLLIVVGSLAAIVLGGLYAALPGVLKAYGGANEIITTIMLNFVATGVVGWLVAGAFGAEGATATRTERIPDYVSFPSVVFSSPDFSMIAFALMLAVVAVVAVVMTRTSFGYDMVTSGHQESAAGYSGVDAKRMIVSSMTFSGMVAGLTGAVFVIMIQGYYTDPTGVGNYGFDAIAISLLAANNPVGVVPAGLLFGALESAGSYITIRTDVPVQLIDGIVGLVVLFVSVPELFRAFAKRTGLGGEER